jgi:2,5-diamino-6-(ribosylamino)-4(3H)-pyrimidinone 5'-phosphate reductase
MNQGAASAAGGEPVRLRRLLPEPGELSSEEATSALRLGELAPPERPYLVLNMISSLDGRATLAERTAGLGGRADRELFHGLRTQADAVMAGAGTVRKERYGRMVRDAERRARRRREGLDEDPLAVVVSGRLTGLADAPLFEAHEQRIAVLTAADDELPPTEAHVEYVRARAAGGAPGRVDLAHALARLRVEWGVRSILCEGGPTLNSDLLHAGVVDELFLSLAPKLLGGEAPLTIVDGSSLPEPVELAPMSAFERDGELFLRLRVHR